MLHTLQGAALAALLLAAAWTDLRRGKIPNALTVSGLIAGLALSSAAGLGVLVGSVQAVALAFALGLALFAGRVLGGGDVKLLIALAAMLGLSSFAVALALTALAGGALSLAVAARRGLLLPVLLDSKDTLVSWTTPGRSAASPASTTGIAVPYGVAIAIGGLGAWFL